ncbi:Holliday junction resolvase YqgF [Acetobacter estunensis NRIC 0472]|uniref:Putative pre-16S rRNA nuclease n=1 Tax=Acetobacter estunensis TaxID=104097 RepID=A0A967ED41_9PROT|nr:Holliday junction resolvase RuvX [Acetobacter estunensis]NHO53916.1 Holliday junction resolvase RuvX [Acetobacter estunensis]GBQ26901.1 Holliday junction resolvase YqgF [Acetobacter estunensis NRIC 0472]
MALFNMAQLMEELSPGQRLLGIDPGSRTIGLALSDVMRMVASPCGVVKRGKLSVVADEIQKIISREDVGGMVVGLPLSLDGSFGPAAQAARDWALALSERLGIRAAVWDERFSSSVVNRLLVGEADLSRKRRQEVVDKLAAAYMLQGVLDHHALRIAPEQE